MRFPRLSTKIQVSVVYEASSFEARETLGRHTSQKFVLQKEEELSYRYSEIQKEIEDLRNRLNDPNLSNEEQDLVKTEIRRLENFSVSVTFPNFVFWSLGGSRPRRMTPDGFFEAVFLVRVIEGETRWRGIQLVAKQKDITYYVSCIIPQQPIPPSHIAGIGGDSMSHFQNCRVPPKISCYRSECTQNESSNLLVDGCSASNKPHILKSISNSRGKEWKEFEESSGTASIPYGRLPSNCLEELTSCSMNSITFLGKTQKWLRKPCQSYLASTIVSNKENSWKPLGSSFSYSFLLGSNEARNNSFIR